METPIILIVTGLIILLVLPPFLNGQIKKKDNRKAASRLCNIFGYLLIIFGAWKALENLFVE